MYLNNKKERKGVNVGVTMTTTTILPNQNECVKLFIFGVRVFGKDHLINRGINYN